MGTKIKSITIERLDGPEYLCCASYFTTLKEVRDFLIATIPTCPFSGYNTFKILIIFEDKLQWAGRLDIHHFTNTFFSEADYTIEKHVEKNLNLYLQLSLDSMLEEKKELDDVILYYRELLRRLRLISELEE